MSLSRKMEHEVSLQVGAKHNPIVGVVVMIIASIIIGYYLTMTIILRNDKTDNRNKLYQSLLMGFWMGLIELLMVGLLMQIWMPSFTVILVLLIIGIILFTALIYWQIGINENQFMLSMIEHHSMAIAMAEQIKPKTQDPKLRKIVDNILESQQREIDQMQGILDEKEVPDNITSLLY